MMKNANMPAMPSDVEVVYEAMTGGDGSWGKAALGLTKREMVSMHIMASIATTIGYQNYGQMAQDAVAAADSLLAELGRECQKS